MAQSSFSGTSLWLVLLGGPTLLFTHCLPWWFDNLSLWPKCKPWKIVDTSSALQTTGLVTTVSCSSSDLSNEIKEECRASKSCMPFSSSLTTGSLFSSFLLILCLLFCSCWYCSYEPLSIFFLLEAKFWVIASKIPLSKHRESFFICSTSWTSLQAVLWCQSLEIHFLSYQCSTKVPFDPSWNGRTAVSDQHSTPLYKPRWRAIFLFLAELGGVNAI